MIFGIVMSPSHFKFAGMGPVRSDRYQRREPEPKTRLPLKFALMSNAQADPTMPQLTFPSAVVAFKLATLESDIPQGDSQECNNIPVPPPCERGSVIEKQDTVAARPRPRAP